MREILTLPIKRGATPSTGSRFTSRLKRRFIAKRQANLEAWLASKHHAISTSANLTKWLAEIWGAEINGVDIMTNRSAKEHEIFANAKSAAQLEDRSSQTVVGVGDYKDEMVEGYVLVFNSKKRSLCFPGGRVRVGQSPIARLEIEMEEETGLFCHALSDEPFTEFFVSENDDHSMSAYKIKFIGGQPMARPTEEEPIEEIVFVARDILLRACQRNERIMTMRHGPQGILPNHRRVFMDFDRSEQGFAAMKQEAVNV